MAQPFQRIGTALLHLFLALGEMVGLFARSLYWCKSALSNARSVLKQLIRVGWDTLPIAILMSTFIGMVMALQSGYGLQKFGATAKYLPTTVAPFILRGVTMYGIDSVMAPFDRRNTAWQRLASDLDPALLDDLSFDLDFADLPRAAEDILDGKIRGRAVVKLP